MILWQNVGHLLVNFDTLKMTEHDLMNDLAESFLTSKHNSCH